MDLDKWIGESEEHARVFTEASDEFEYLVMNADISILKEALQAHPSRRNAAEAEEVKKLDLGGGEWVSRISIFPFQVPQILLS